MMSLQFVHKYAVPDTAYVASHVSTNASWIAHLCGGAFNTVRHHAGVQNNATRAVSVYKLCMHVLEL